MVQGFSLDWRGHAPCGAISKIEMLFKGLLDSLENSDLHMLQCSHVSESGCSFQKVNKAPRTTFLCTGQQSNIQDAPLAFRGFYWQSIGSAACISVIPLDNACTAPAKACLWPMGLLRIGASAQAVYAACCCRGILPVWLDQLIGGHSALAIRSQALAICCEADIWVLIL